MGIGALFLTSISTGIITSDELEWVARNQTRFSRCELLTAFKLGYLVDSGKLNIGFRSSIF